MLTPRRADNRLLASFRDPDLQKLESLLRPVRLQQGTVVFDADSVMAKAYFPETAVISLVVPLSSGQMVEAAMIGRDGVLGNLAAIEGKPSRCRAVVQIAGSALEIDMQRLRTVINESATLRREFILYNQAVLAGSAQSAACNATHTLDARLAKWLLRSRDLCGADEMQITQEFMADMLGVRRPSVSVTASGFQERGLISYQRGRVRLLDLEALRVVACECYHALNSYRDHLLRLEGTTFGSENISAN